MKDVGTKYTIIFSRDEADRIKAMAWLLDVKTPTHVIRSALQVFESLLEHHQEGGQLIMRKDGKDEVAKVFVA